MIRYLTRLALRFRQLDSLESELVHMSTRFAVGDADAFEDLIYEYQRRGFHLIDLLRMHRNRLDRSQRTAAVLGRHATAIQLSIELTRANLAIRRCEKVCNV